jgi:hypothetical protein
MDVRTAQALVHFGLAAVGDAPVSTAVPSPGVPGASRAKKGLGPKMIRIFEISATGLLLAFVAPLIVVKWTCLVLLRLLRILCFDELMAVLMRVMRGEVALRHIYRALTRPDDLHTSAESS